jgi:LuxR family transcriptional regulator, maltose regulon positive regulatory protein
MPLVGRPEQGCAAVTRPDEWTRRRGQSAGASIGQEGLLLAQAKLAAPRLPPRLVDRPRLTEALDSGDATGTRLTLVAAPAGFGKTTAVLAWCAERPLAWITLDAGDNDPVRLWTYVATAIDGVREGLGRGALQRLRLAGGAIEAAIDELMNGLGSLTEDVVIVLDDLHTVTDEECLASIDYALERMPAAARLIAISRADPALRLARRRAAGALVELRASDLAFTRSEAGELVTQHGGVDLGVEEMQALHERTEGWPAALLLASIWLRTVDDPRRALREFGGGHRFVADYLSQEVVASLDADTQTFLLSASVLGRFTADLCDSVLSRSDSASILARLERGNLLVSRLEHGGWYRVHPLLAEFAAAELGAVDPEAATEIHRRAGLWLEEHGLAVEAAQHAAAAEDHDLVARILVEHHLTLIRTGGARTLLRWVRSLPDDTLLGHPELAVGGATAAGMVGGSSLEQRRLLGLAERARTERPDRFSPYAATVAAMVRAATVDGDVGLSVEAGRQAVELAEAGVDSVFVAAHAGHARALYFAGDLDAAWAAAMRALEHPDAERRPPGHSLARSTLALVAVEQRHLTSARTHAETAKAIVGRLGGSRSWIGANAAAAVGAVQEAEGHLAEAEREFAYAERFFRDEVATVHHTWLLVVLARIRCGRGRLDASRTTLRAALDELSELADGGRLASLAAAVSAELERATARAGTGEILELPSEAELAVLRQLASDLSTREIGGELFLSANTVRTHARAIYRKLRVSSRADAVARAGELGLLPDSESRR